MNKTKSIETLYLSIKFIFFILIIESILISVFTQHLPNTIVSDFFYNLSYFKLLFDANPNMAYQFILIDKPIFTIESVYNKNQVWAIYIMPITLFTLACFSILLYNLKNRYFLSIIPMLISSILIATSVFYLRLHTCCTANPSWVFEIWIFSHISDPAYDSPYWQDMYIGLTPWFTHLQLIIALTSTFILIALPLIRRAGKK